MINKMAIQATCLGLVLIGTALVQNPITSAGQQDSAKPQPAPTMVSVLVLDHKDQAVTDLDQSELQLFLGKEQVPIESLSRAPNAPAEIAILIDTSGSERGFLQSLRRKDDADPTSQLVRDGDRAFVATFSKGNNLICPMTSDVAQIRTALHTAIFAVPPGGVTAIYDAIFWASTVAFTAQPGHKALVVISDMMDNQSSHTRREAGEQAQRLGICIFPVIPPAAVGSNPRGETIAKSLASFTGGVAYVEKPGELRAVFTEIRSDVRDTYTISFRPTSTEHGPLKIKCTRKGTKIVAPEQKF